MQLRALQHNTKQRIQSGQRISTNQSNALISASMNNALQLQPSPLASSSFLINVVCNNDATMMSGKPQLVLKSPQQVAYQGIVSPYTVASPNAHSQMAMIFSAKSNCFLPNHNKSSMMRRYQASHKQYPINDQNNNNPNIGTQNNRIRCSTTKARKNALNMLNFKLVNKKSKFSEKHFAMNSTGSDIGGFNRENSPNLILHQQTHSQSHKKNVFKHLHIMTNQADSIMMPQQNQELQRLIITPSRMSQNLSINRVYIDRNSSLEDQPSLNNTDFNFYDDGRNMEPRNISLFQQSSKPSPPQREHNKDSHEMNSLQNADDSLNRESDPYTQQQMSEDDGSNSPKTQQSQVFNVIVSPTEKLNQNSKIKPRMRKELSRTQMYIQSKKLLENQHEQEKTLQEFRGRMMNNQEDESSIGILSRSIEIVVVQSSNPSRHATLRNEANKSFLAKKHTAIDKNGNQNQEMQRSMQQNHTSPQYDNQYFNLAQMSRQIQQIHASALPKKITKQSSQHHQHRNLMFQSDDYQQVQIQRLNQLDSAYGPFIEDNLNVPSSQGMLESATQESQQHPKTAIYKNQDNEVPFIYSVDDLPNQVHEQQLSKEIRLLNTSGINNAQLSHSVTPIFLAVYPEASNKSPSPVNFGSLNDDNKVFTKLKNKGPFIDNCDIPSKKISNNLPLEDMPMHGHITNFTVQQIGDPNKQQNQIYENDINSVHTYTDKKLTLSQSVEMQRQKQVKNQQEKFNPFVHQRKQSQLKKRGGLDFKVKGTNIKPIKQIIQHSEMLANATKCAAHFDETQRLNLRAIESAANSDIMLNSQYGTSQYPHKSGSQSMATLYQSCRQRAHRRHLSNDDNNSFVINRTIENHNKQLLQQRPDSPDDYCGTTLYQKEDSQRKLNQASSRDLDRPSSVISNQYHIKQYVTKIDTVHSPLNMRPKANQELVKPTFNNNHSSYASLPKNTMQNQEKGINYRISSPILYVETIQNNKPLLEQYSNMVVNEQKELNVDKNDLKIQQSQSKLMQNIGRDLQNVCPRALVSLPNYNIQKLNKPQTAQSQSKKQIRKNVITGDRRSSASSNTQDLFKGADEETDEYKIDVSQIQQDYPYDQFNRNAYQIGNSPSKSQIVTNLNQNQGGYYSNHQSHLLEYYMQDKSTIFQPQNVLDPTNTSRSNILLMRSSKLTQRFNNMQPQSIHESFKLSRRKLVSAENSAFDITSPACRSMQASGTMKQTGLISSAQLFIKSNYENVTPPNYQQNQNSGIQSTTNFVNGSRPQTAKNNHPATQNAGQATQSGIIREKRQMTSSIGRSGFIGNDGRIGKQAQIFKKLKVRQQQCNINDLYIERQSFQR